MSDDAEPIDDPHDDIEPKERKPRGAKRGGLFVTDAELIERIGVPEYLARGALQMLDRDPRSGFPKKNKFWGNRRYWPAVQQYFDETCAGRKANWVRDGIETVPEPRRKKILAPRQP